MSTMTYLRCWIWPLRLQFRSRLPRRWNSISTWTPSQKRALRSSRNISAAEAAVDHAMQALSETDAEMGIEHDMERSSLSVVDLEKTNFESSLLDFDFELGEDTNVSRSRIDLSDISLQTDAGLKAAAPAVAPAPATPAHQSEFVDTSAASQPAVGTIDVHDEVSTKLELARAYEEMGDIEGARELLEEVMADGAEQQKQMAQTILTRIA